MKAPTRKPVYFPEPPEINLEAPPRIWHRYRIVIQAYDQEQADRLSEKVAEFCGHSVEQLWSVTDDEGNGLMGEAVLQRKTVPVNARVPLEDSSHA